MAAVFDLVREHGICGVVLLSGDTHFAAVYSYDVSPSSATDPPTDAVRVWEFSASPFAGFPFEPDAHPGEREPESHRPWRERRHFAVGWGYHYGLLRIDPVPPTAAPRGREMSNRSLPGIDVEIQRLTGAMHAGVAASFTLGQHPDDDAYAAPPGEPDSVWRQRLSWSELYASPDCRSRPRGL